MKKSIYVAPANAQWTKSILNEFLTIDRLDKNSNSDKFLGYEKIKIMFIDRKLHEKYNVKLEDSLIKWINPNYNLQSLYRFDKSYNCAQAVNLTLAAKSGLLPITSYLHFGQTSVELKKSKNSKKYILRITKNQISQLDKFVKSVKNQVTKISAQVFNETVNSFHGKKSKAAISEFEKARKLLNQARQILRNNNFTQAEKLALQSIALIINSELLGTKKPVKKAAKKTVKNTVKKAA